MADSQIGSLRVALSLGTAEFEAGANKAAAISKAKAKEIEGAFSGAKAAVSGLFAAFTVGLLTEQIKKSLDYAGSLAEVSRTLGVTTKDLQTFRFAATQSGVAQDQLEVGLRRLTVSMGKAELGSKAQAKAFAAIGISVEQLKGKNTGDVFRLMADGLSKVTDRSQRAAIEMTLMGRSGSTLDNLLAPGSRRLNDLADAAQRLGIVLSDSQIQGAEETAHKLAAVKEVLAAQIAGVVANNAQAILSLSSALATLTGSIIKFLGSNPQTALAIIGGLAGAAIGSKGGLIGAAAGAVAGTVGGSYLGALQSNANTDLDYRVQQMRAAQKDALNAENTPGVSNVTRKNTRDKFLEQLDLLKKATVQFKAQSGAGSTAPAGVTLPQFLGDGGGRTRHPRAGGGGAGPQDRTEQDEFQFAQQMRVQDLQILEARKSLSHDYVEQTTLSIQQLDVEKAIRDAEIDHKVEQAKRDAADGKITQSTLAQIVTEAGIEKQKEATLDHLKRQAVLDAEQEQRLHDSAALDQQQLEIHKQRLEDELALAGGADERRDLQLAILDIDRQIEKAKLDEVLADTQISDADKQRARNAYVASGHEQGLKAQAIVQQTQGPLGQYLQSLPTDAAKWKEALQSVAVDGFGALTNAADTLAGKIVKVGGIFGDVTRTILADLLKIELQKMVIAPLANALSGLLGGGGGVVDLTGAQFASQIPHFATGGSFMIGGNSGTDQNTLALNGLPIAKVSHGETLNVGTGGGSSARPINIQQTFRFEGVAVTEEKFVRGLVATKAATMAAIRDAQRRR